MILDQFILRLRRSAVPGRAPAVAVPSDEESELQAELAPVFEFLQPLVDSISRIERDASSQAAQLVYEANMEARSWVERARQREGQITADAMADELRRSQEEGRDFLAAAEAEAVRIATVSAGRTAQLVRKIVDVVVGVPETGSAR
jgi:vacuolar-type H+-ATPase subunit H